LQKSHRNNFPVRAVSTHEAATGLRPCGGTKYGHALARASRGDLAPPAGCGIADYFNAYKKLPQPACRLLGYRSTIIATMTIPHALKECAVYNKAFTKEPVAVFSCLVETTLQ
jgi:hypothetical protein